MIIFALCYNQNNVFQIFCKISRRNNPMSFTGFTDRDFDSMDVPGLEQRMDAIITNVRPKLTDIGEGLEPFLSVLTQDNMYPHVAKHARRTVHPPVDTWVAWSSSNRGYKALPHFQVGMFSTHLFIVFAVIYESANKEIFGRYLERHASKVHKQTPAHFYWSMDHMAPGGEQNGDIPASRLEEFAQKLQKVKKAEIVCGLNLPRSAPEVKDGEQLMELIRSTFEQLLPLYKASF